MREKYRSATVVVAVVIERLLTNVTGFASREEELVIDAIRRSTNALNDASIPEIAEFIGEMSPIQANGFFNNVKGIYHELIFAEAENLDGDAVSAEVFLETNHPGADVMFISDGRIIQEVQLKATYDPYYVREHLMKYEDTEVLATEEVASVLPGVESSGFSNEGLTQDIEDVRAQLGSSSIENVVDGAETSILVSAAIQAHGILRGKEELDEKTLKNLMQDAAVGGGAAIILEMLIG
jgi:hypothetical protein